MFIMVRDTGIMAMASDIYVGMSAFKALDKIIPIDDAETLVKLSPSFLGSNLTCREIWCDFLAIWKGISSFLSWYENL